MLLALQDLAASYRKQLSAKVIGITGSNGKTTTKDMIASILELSFKVHKTKGNYNSQLGLPLTILEAPDDVEILILELGMSEKGQIKKLSEIAQPDIAAITMIGTSHLLNLGSREEIAKAKMEILEGLTSNGLFIYQEDEPLLNNDMNHRSVTFGETNNNDYYPRFVDSNFEGNSFYVNNQKDTDYTIPMLGKHNVQNALIAIAIADELKVPKDIIVKGLANISVTGMRMQSIFSENGFTVIDDCYNASPDSVKGAIDTLHEIKGYKKKFLILADMLELGEEDEKYHKEIGNLINEKKIDYVFTYGRLANFISLEAAQKLGFDHSKNFSDKPEMIKVITELIGPNDIVLVKGSRGMNMEDVVNGLL
jgi:UDP-N-acetylmuramoyl-tripeptide--D-alanyl-D-alanine ligase